jgi:membrane fusion protein (multidrug efflux system)
MSRSPFLPHRASRLLVLSLAAAPLLAACGKESANAAPGAPGGRPGGRPPLVLATTDVVALDRGPLESGVAITGDLRPIETVQVRARLEGDLTGVFVRPGDRVRQGQLLAQFRATEEVANRSAAEADRAAARTELSTAQWNLEQTRELFRAGAIPERDVRLAEQTVAGAQARVAAAQARLGSSARDVGDTRVLAPTGGVVESREVQGGERVSNGALLFTIVRGDRLELTASVPGRLAGDLRAGQVARFTADGRTFEGKVARVSPTIDPVTRAATVFIEVPNANGALRGNTLATGRVVGRTIPDALLLPVQALRQSAQGTQADGQATQFVYRIVGETVQRAPVSLGIIDEVAGLAEVVDGLSAGDRVVVGNVGAIGEGVKVQIVGGGEGRGAGTRTPAGTPNAAPGTKADTARPRTP